MFVIAPGFESAFVPLNDAMHLARENQIKEHAQRAEKRRQSGAPQSDNVDYAAVADALEVAKKAAATGDDAAIFEAFDLVAAEMAPTSRPPPPFEPVPEWDGVTVANVLLSRAEWADGFAEIAVDETGAAMRNLLDKCIKVHGIRVQGEMENNATMWEHAGIHGHLLAIARHFQTMSFEEKKRYGLQAVSI